MGAQQVLRAALAVALLVPAAAYADDAKPAGKPGWSGKKPPAAPKAPPDEVLIIVDLRPGDPAALTSSRDKMKQELAGIQGLAVLGGPDLDAALGGGAEQDSARIAAALTAAREAYGALDCKKTKTQAQKAIHDLSARQAAGLEDLPALRSAYAYVFLCADRDGDVDTAARAAGALRRLGVKTGDEVGINPKTWARFPEIDATGGELTAVTIEAEPAGAAAWVDHRAVGTAPVTVMLAPGAHTIAIAKGWQRDAYPLVAAGKTQSLAVKLPDQRGKWNELGDLVRSWREGKATPSAAGLTTIMVATKVRFAIVLAGTRTAEVWAKRKHDKVAKKLDNALVDQPFEVGALIVDRVAAWDGRAPDPDEPLLTETRAERDERYGKKDYPTKWYVYAALAAGIVIGGAVIYANETADDHQRIVIQGP